MTKLQVRTDIAVLASGWRTQDKSINKLISRCVTAVLEFARSLLPKSHVVRQAKEGLEVSVVLATDARIRTLNRAYRKKDKPTNVLSFPALDSAAPQAPGPLILGDVILALQTVRKESKAENKAFRAHTAHLVAHGVLHLLGYDHVQERDAKKMERLERLVMARLGFADPYAETVPDRGAAARKR